VAGLELAAELGANTASLTGVLPSVTDHGRNVQSWVGDREDLPVVTTGDATRVATVVKSVQGILDAAGRDMSGEHLAMIGLGSIGAGSLYILSRHILPNIMPVVIVLFTTRVGATILSEAGLSFLGLGVPPPAPTWGSMLSGAGRQYMFQAPWLTIWPGLALAITVYSINMFGDAVRDIADPRLRGGAGRYGARKLKRKDKSETKEEKKTKI